MNYFSYLWAIPFCAFLLGYQLMHLIVGSQEFPLPNIVGLPLEQALIDLSHHDISVRILNVKEDTQVAPGTILSQTPSANTKSKKGQIIYCVVSKKPEIQQTPTLLGKTNQEIASLLDQRNLTAKYYFFEDEAIANTCFAQSPEPGTPLENTTIIAYISKGAPKSVLCPNYLNKPVLEVQEVLEKQGIIPQIQHAIPLNAGHDCEACVVIEQRPAPGSIMTLNNKIPTQIQLLVKPV
jgi:serine/threonine-protein kinase